jgi:hypothetical protein
MHLQKFFLYHLPKKSRDLLLDPSHVANLTKTTAFHLSLGDFFANLLSINFSFKRKLC